MHRCGERSRRAHRDRCRSVTRRPRMSAGGDRFDIGQNRALGRAYLALLHRRYGNWPDAVSAYNWGIGNLDTWISGGRTSEKLVPRYTCGADCKITEVVVRKLFAFKKSKYQS